MWADILIAITFIYVVYRNSCGDEHYSKAMPIESENNTRETQINKNIDPGDMLFIAAMDEFINDHNEGETNV